MRFRSGLDYHGWQIIPEDHPTTQNTEPFLWRTGLCLFEVLNDPSKGSIHISHWMTWGYQQFMKSPSWLYFSFLPGVKSQRLSSSLPASAMVILASFRRKRRSSGRKSCATTGRKQRSYFLWQNLPQICQSTYLRTVRWHMDLNFSCSMSVVKLCCHIECLMVWWCQNLPPQHACTPPPWSRHKSEAQFACQK